MWPMTLMARGRVRCAAPCSNKKGLWWNWEVDDDNYPGWDSLCHNLSQAGTKMLTYINPYLVRIRRDACRLCVRAVGKAA